jgi:hypothetical protein
MSVPGEVSWPSMGNFKWPLTVRARGRDTRPRRCPGQRLVRTEGEGRSDLQGNLRIPPPTFASPMRPARRSRRSCARATPRPTMRPHSRSSRRRPWPNCPSPSLRVTTPVTTPNSPRARSSRAENATPRSSVVRSNAQITGAIYATFERGARAAFAQAEWRSGRACPPARYEMTQYLVS